MSKNVLVTGASGYIAMHVVDQLLKAGHRVRGTVRSVKDEAKVTPIRKLDTSGDKLELVEAELLDAAAWEKACQGIDIVMHVASPVTHSQVEDEVIKPALEGTLNVMNAALKANVKKLIFTSSTLTIYGYNSENRVYDERDWADVFFIFHKFIFI